MPLPIRVTVTLTLALASAQLAVAQSDAAFPPGIYAARRAKLVRETGDALIIVPGRLLAGADDSGKQDPDFWYLTGVESPFAVLVLSPRPNMPPHTVLFLPAAYQLAGGQFPALDDGFRRAVWNQPRRRLVPGPEAARLTGVDETHPIDELVPRLRTMAANARLIYMPWGDDVGYTPPGMLAARTFTAQFARALAAAIPNAQWNDVTPFVRKLRLVKDAPEIAALRRAAEISALGMREGLRALRPGMNDRELAGLMEYVWKREGSPRAAFHPSFHPGRTRSRSSRSCARTTIRSIA